MRPPILSSPSTLHPSPTSRPRAVGHVGSGPPGEPIPFLLHGPPPPHLSCPARSEIRPADLPSSLPPALWCWKWFGAPPTYVPGVWARRPLKELPTAPQEGSESEELPSPPGHQRAEDQQELEHPSDITSNLFFLSPVVCSSALGPRDVLVQGSSSRSGLNSAWPPNPEARGSGARGA